MSIAKYQVDNSIPTNMCLITSQLGYFRKGSVYMGKQPVWSARQEQGMSNSRHTPLGSDSRRSATNLTPLFCNFVFRTLAHEVCMHGNVLVKLFICFANQIQHKSVRLYRVTFRIHLSRLVAMIPRSWCGMNRRA